MPLFLRDSGVSLRLQDLSRFYRFVDDLPDSLAPSSALRLQAIFNARALDEVIYEGRPTLADMATEERDQILQEVLGITAVLQSILLAMCQGSGLSPSEDERITFELVTPLIQLLPEMSALNADRIIRHVKSLAWAEGSIEETICKGVEHIVLMHHQLTEARRLLGAESGTLRT